MGGDEGATFPHREQSVQRKRRRGTNTTKRYVREPLAERGRGLWGLEAGETDTRGSQQKTYS